MTQLRSLKTLTALGMSISIGLVLLTLMLMPLDVSAQVARTPRSRDSANTQLQGNIQATLQAQSTQIAATAQAMADNAAARVTDAVSTMQDGATDIAATVAYVATQAAQSRESIEATVTAIYNAIDTMPPELEALLNTLADQGSISYNGESLTATLYISEAQANDLLDILIEGAGYDPDSARLDTQADGTIAVILTDITGEYPGTLVLTYQVGVSPDGTVTYTLVSATLNGTPIPLERLPDELTQPISLAIYATLIQPMLGTDTVYHVQSIVVSDDGVLLVVDVPVPQ